MDEVKTKDDITCNMVMLYQSNVVHDTYSVVSGSIVNHFIMRGNDVIFAGYDDLLLGSWGACRVWDFPDSYMSLKVKLRSIKANINCVLVYDSNKVCGTGIDYPQFS